MARRINRGCVQRVGDFAAQERDVGGRSIVGRGCEEPDNAQLTGQLALITIELDADIIIKEKPDAVVVAVGAVPGYPDVPGLDSPNVIKSTTLYNLLRFILRFFGPAFLNWISKIRLPAGWNPFKTIGKRVVIIGGAIHEFT